jgi:hypothetical protein
MKRLYISTMHRLSVGGKPHGELGYVYLYDWENDAHLRKPIEIQPLKMPQSSSYGVRGLAVHDGLLHVATTGDSILVFELDTWKLMGEIGHPELKYIHQIRSHEGLLCVVNTGKDTLCKFSRGQLCDIVDLSTEAVQLGPFAIQRTCDDRWGNDMLHFNSIGWAPNGDEYHVYFNARMVFNWTQKKIMYQGGILHSPHDVVVTDQGFFTSSSADKSALFFKNNGDIRVIHKSLRFTPPFSVNQHGFKHGLAIGDGMLFTGTSPTRLETFDIANNFNILGAVDLSYAENECIYDIALDPRDWIC